MTDFQKDLKETSVNLNRLFLIKMRSLELIIIAPLVMYSVKKNSHPKMENWNFLSLYIVQHSSVEMQMNTNCIVYHAESACMKPEKD